MHLVNCNRGHRIIITFLLFLFLIYGVQSIQAQNNFTLSKNADFSTEDRIFDYNDTIYMKVVAPSIDFTNIDKNEFELKAENGGDKYEGAFTNLLSSEYTASLPLGNLNSSEEKWQWKARIRDDSGNEFRVEVDISIFGGTKIEELEVKGKIEQLGSDFLVLKGAKIFINTQTVILDNNSNVLEFGDLSIGDNVEIKAIRQANNNLLAVTIKVRGREQGEIEVKGRIDSVGVDHLVVLGGTFYVDINSELLDKDKNPISLSDLVVGLTVKIKAKKQPDGRLLVTRLRVEDKNDNEVELTGTIESLTDTSITVSGISFSVSAATKIVDHDDNPISLNELLVGMLVEIRGERQTSGALFASKIKVENEVPGENEIEITGEIKEIGVNKLVVSNIAFIVDGNTVILDEHKRPISFTDLQGGVIVEVKARVQPDGSYLATRIKIEDRLQNKIELTGKIESLGDSSLVVNGKEFIVNKNTVLLDQKKRPIEFSALVVGLIVEIHAEILLDGTLWATKIKIEDSKEDKIEITGTIDSLGADSLTVSGITFYVDASTLYLDENKNPVDFSALKVSQIVEVKGERRTDNRFWAIRIQIEKRVEDEIEVKGLVDALTSSTITVSGLTFNVVENTIVLDRNKNKISLTELSSGMIVEVRGELLPGGTLIALQVKVKDDQTNELEVKGPIDSLDVDAVFVLGIKIRVDGNTIILDKKKNLMSFSDLKVGQFIKVKAQLQPDGTFLASKIKIEEVVVISGLLSSISANRITIFDFKMSTNDSTLILGVQNLPLSFNDLRTGQTIEARATKLDDGSLSVSKIKVLNATVTGVEVADDGDALPKDFLLEQNYPNPFNPTTTISFNLLSDGGSQSQVSLVIYNVLGQTVRTLLNQSIPPGIYQIQWDGRDGFGNQLPSGVYLYRLKTKQFAETRRMVLVK